MFIQKNLKVSVAVINPSLSRELFPSPRAAVGVTPQQRDRPGKVSINYSESLALSPVIKYNTVRGARCEHTPLRWPCKFARPVPGVRPDQNCSLEISV